MKSLQLSNLAMLVAFALLFSATSIFAQTFNNPTDPLDLCADVQAGQTTYGDMMGINFKNFNDVPSGENMGDLVSFVRYFHLMNGSSGRDYGTSTPVNYTSQPCQPYALPLSPSTCYSCTGGNMSDMRSRYCIARTAGITKIHASIETLQGYTNWYDKNFTQAEWGGSLSNIFNEGREYGAKFAENYCPTGSGNACLVDVLEIGNEAWGIPGKPAYQALYRGLIQGVNDYYTGTFPTINYGSGTPLNPANLNKNAWRMKISAGSYQYIQSSTYNGTNDEISTMPSDAWPYLEYVNVHPYSFRLNRNGNGDMQSGTNELSQHPESQTSLFLALLNAAKWRKDNQTGKGLAATEFGWDSKTVGLDAQAIYTVRGFLMFGRFDYDQAVLYELLDDGFGNELFESTGLFDANGNKKPAYHAVKRFKSLFNDKIFLDQLNTKDYQDTDNTYFAYLVGGTDRKATHLAIWLPKNINFNANLSAESKTISLPNGLGINMGGTATKLDGSTTDQNVAVNSIVSQSGGAYTISASPIPYLIPLNANNYTYPSPANELDVNDCNSTCSLSPAQSSTSISANGGTVNMVINGTNNTLSATSSNGSFSATASGSSIGVTAGANNTGTTRSTTITVTAAGCSSTSFTVSQSANGGGGCIDNTTCPGVTISACASSIELTLTNSDATIIKVFDSNWNVEAELCNDYNSPACSSGLNTSVNVSPGTYNIQIQKANATDCNYSIVVGASCVDNDMDGSCQPADCDDNDSTILAPGSACDDGNPGTINDTRQADCTCVGTPVGGCNDNNDCPKVTIASCPGKIELTVNQSNVSYVKVMDAGWNTIGFLCKTWSGGNCNNGLNSSINVTGGDYRIEAQYTDGTTGCSIYPFNVPSGARLVAVSEEGLKLYPNPARERLNIDMGMFAGKEGELNVYNTLGQRVYGISLGGERLLSLDLTGFDSGIYIVHLEIQGKMQARRFVVE